MGRAFHNDRGLPLRTIFAVLLAYLLVAQALLAPVAQARAMQADQLAQALGVICAHDSDGNPSPDGTPAQHQHDHCGDCCLSMHGQAFAGPLALAFTFFAFPVPRRAPQTFIAEGSRGRAPPDETSGPRVVRGPPLSA